MGNISEDLSHISSLASGKVRLPLGYPSPPGYVAS